MQGLLFNVSYYSFIAKVKESNMLEDVYSRLFPNQRFVQSLRQTYYVLKQTS
ncbi:hypothetical protein [uncultured Parvimonas sp.]|uniref:hypothetical protein n=1 Tax=uncultured Parvimonas sp. TaxID=747372 RepID=UPI002804B457|nr:hypothetical protein [uncultured Parvimonas sp.]